MVKEQFENQAKRYSPSPNIALVILLIHPSRYLSPTIRRCNKKAEKKFLCLRVSSRLTRSSLGLRHAHLTNIRAGGPVLGRFPETHLRPELLGLPGLVDHPVEFVYLLESEACNGEIGMLVYWDKTW